MLMCMESEVCCGWLQCSCYTEHGRHGTCMSCLYGTETVECMSSARSVWYVEKIRTLMKCEVKT